MTEFEFFATYEIRTMVGAPGDEPLGVEVWKRDGGMYGEIRRVNISDFLAEIHTTDGRYRSVGTRKSFDGAFKLLRNALA